MKHQKWNLFILNNGERKLITKWAARWQNKSSLRKLLDELGCRKRYFKRVILFMFISWSSNAQTGSIVPKQDTISPQVSHNAPYSYFPVYSFDTTKEGVIMRKVAECTNGVWKVFDSAKAETIINNEYQKINQ